MNGSGSSGSSLAHTESRLRATPSPESTVCAIAEIIGSSQPLEQIGASLAALVGAALGATRTDVWRLDRDRGRLALEARWHVPGEVVSAPSGPHELALALRPDLLDLVEGRRGAGDWRDDMAAGGGEGRRTILEVPIVFRKQVVGVLTAGRDGGTGTSSSEDGRVLGMLRPQIGLFLNEIVEARRREAEARQRKAILKASWAVNSLVETGAVLKWLTREAMEGMNVSRAAMYLYDVTADTLVLEATSQTDASEHGRPLAACALDDNLGEWQILSQPNVLIEQIGAPLLPVDRRQTMTELGEFSALSVPIWFNNVPLGILRCSQIDSPRTFSDSEIELAVALGQQAAVAVNNAIDVDRRRLHDRRLAHLAGACRSLSSGIDVESDMTTLARDLLAAFDQMTGVDVYEYLPDDDAIRARFSVMPETPEEAAEFVGTTYSLQEKPSYRRALLGNRVVEYHIDDERLARTDPQLHGEMVGWGERTVIETALMIGDQPIGLLSMVSTRDAGFLNDEDKDLLFAFAAVAARLMKTASRNGKVESGR